MSLSMLAPWLKAQTEAIHTQVERSIDIHRIRSLDDYTQLLQNLYGIHSALETLLHPWLHPIENEIDWTARKKVKAIEADLSALGITADSLSPLAPPFLLPDVTSLAGALGCLYVVEGSTLGGQMVRQILCRRLEHHGVTNFHFYEVYGDKCRERWNHFTEYLNRFGALNASAWPEVLIAAQQTFHLFQDGMKNQCQTPKLNAI